jgi:hypothetical protein
MWCSRLYDVEKSSFIMLLTMSSMSDGCGLPVQLYTALSSILS